MNLNQKSVNRAYKSEQPKLESLDSTTTKILAQLSGERTLKMDDLFPSTRPIEPFLKWAGGKRWLVRRSNDIAPPTYERYIEPFLGSAAIFFSLPKTPFILSDINPDLINCYKAIRDDWQSVEKYIKLHQRNHSDDYYYKLRDSKPQLTYTKAAKFIYLNRTCWNGLYRVNLKGEFNVPRGTKNKVVLESDNFSEAASRLKEGKILCNDFEKTIDSTREGDFIFVDPPYTVKHNQNGFLKYNEKIFSWSDQKRLKTSLFRAAERGVKITLTNANHQSIKDLYNQDCQIEECSRKSILAANNRYRGLTTELIIRIGW